MTIKEAAELVIQASSLAEGGDVFVLDMGQPIKIKDLAYRMVELSGLKVKDKSNPDGDIEIKVTGLRPGEKLYEELLIDPETASPTMHPRIFCSNEPIPDRAFLQDHLQKLEEAIQLNEYDKMIEILKILVPEYSMPSRFIPQIPKKSLSEKSLLN